MTLISGPIAPERNPNIHPEWYEPSRFQISSITSGATTTVTTTVAHNYVIGQEVRLNIPKVYGMYQINEQTGFVQSIPMTTQVVLNIDSTNYNTYITSPTNPRNVAQIIAIGDVNSGVTNATGLTSQGTYVPGSFIDISPL